MSDLPLLRTEVPGPRSRALASDLHLWESQNVTFVDPAGRFPIFWETAQGCLVADVDGNTFLDLTAAFGVAAVGHTNPRVARAIADQSMRLIHGMGDVHPSALKVALARRSPSGRRAIWAAVSSGRTAAMPWKRR
jgi:4-aminobutyrate aminotransferase/(S)-3-amino-2-methylpropionate transaminase